MNKLTFIISENTISVAQNGQELCKGKYAFDKMGAHKIYCFFVDGNNYETFNKGIMFWRKTFLQRNSEIIGKLSDRSIDSKGSYYRIDSRFGLVLEDKVIATLETDSSKDWCIELPSKCDKDVPLITILCLNALRPTFGVAGGAA